MTEKKFKAIGIGEILWDLIPEGKMLGGAPTNFAFHANQLNIRSGIISAIGKDDLGNEIRTKISSSGVMDFIGEDSHPTGTVSVKLDNQGIPTYIIHENVAWDYIEPDEEAMDFIGKADVICFGSLAQRSDKSRSSIRNVLRNAPEPSLKIYDINLRQQFYSKDIIEQSIGLANILKINEEEVRIFAEMFNINGDEFEIINTIRSDFNLQVIALTKGAQGSWLVTENENSYIDTPGVRIVDTVGAGDSFTAAMAAGLLNKLPLQEVHQLAVDVSAFVCTQKGATPELPAELINRLHD